MSDIKETIYYKELRAGDLVQAGDQFRDVDGQWKPYTCLAHMGGKVEFGETARRPIRTTHQTTYEEVPGSRTLQQAVEQPQRERWAYEELQPGDVIEAGDQWQNSDGRWRALVLIAGASTQVQDSIRARRPHNITMMLAAFASSAEVLADAQKAATQLQDERDELKAALRECGAAHKVTMEQRLAACSERDEACKERDEARAEMERLSTALKSAQRARDELQRQVDELRADRTNEVTARQVQQVLHRWATELEWSADCFGSATREQVHGVQNTLIAVMQRIESMIDAEGTSADT